MANETTKLWRMWEVVAGVAQYERFYATRDAAKRAADRRRSRTGMPHMYERRDAVPPVSHWRA